MDASALHYLAAAVTGFALARLARSAGRLKATDRRLLAVVAERTEFERERRRNLTRIHAAHVDYRRSL